MLSQIDPVIVATLRRNLTGDSGFVERMISPGTDLNTLANATGLSTAQLESLASLSREDKAAVFDKVRASRGTATADGTAGGATFVAQMAGPSASPTGPLHMRMPAAALVPTAE